MLKMRESFGLIRQFCSEIFFRLRRKLTRRKPLFSPGHSVQSFNAEQQQHFNDLLSTGHYDQAEQMIRDLLKDAPDVTEAANG